MPASFSRMNGKDRPAKFEPPPVQPMMWVGVSPAISSWSSASSPMIVWCSSTWLSTEPRAYRVFGSLAATSTASEIAMPSEPDQFFGSAASARPTSVRSDGERWTRPPKASIMRRR